MTTAPTMLPRTPAGSTRAHASRTLVVLAMLVGTLGACDTSTNDRALAAPTVLVAPYDTTRGEALWAVAPLRNESGTTLVDGFEITDKVILAVEEVRGLRCLPLNRVIEGMRTLEMPVVRTPEDARALAAALGADGLIVGSITAFDPYNPPKLGLSLALYTRAGSPGSEPSLDPRALSSSPTDPTASAMGWNGSRPTGVVSELLDSANHQVLMDVRTFAQGRHDDRSALGWEVYLASMDRYAQFAAHHVVDRLIQNEWLRLTNEAGRQAQAPH